ncbi:MAG: hypothetical protein WBH56_12495, partial [Bacteroidota bacterium]
MKIAQFEDNQGLCVSIERGGEWINYSKAEVLYYLLRHGVAVEQVPTIQYLLESGEYSLSGMKQILDFVTKG